MNKLLVVLFATAFGFFSVSAMADDTSIKPLSKMETNEAKAARAAAKEQWAKMTPQEQAAERKAAHGKKQADLTALDAIANNPMKYNTKQGAENTAKSKEVPKPTKAERQKALNETEKNAGPSQ